MYFLKNFVFILLLLFIAAFVLVSAVIIVYPILAHLAARYFQ